MGNRCRVAATLINRDLVGEPVRTNSLEQAGCGRGSITVRGQQTINRPPVGIDRALQIFPLVFAAHVGLLPPPALPHWPLPAAALFYDLRDILDDPTVERGGIHHHPTLSPHFFQLPALSTC